MDFQHSCALTLPWMWVIDTLAHSNQVDVSLLLDLANMTPKIHDAGGKNVVELLSLKILESIVVPEDNIDLVSSKSISKVGFDPSESCEDVLRQISSEASLSTWKTAGRQNMKWDLQTFVAQKRSCLTKCLLQKLKDAILTGSHPLLASLKKQSGMTVGNHAEDQVLVDGSICKGIALIHERADPIFQIVDDKLIDSALVDAIHPKHKPRTDENSLLAEMKISDTFENVGGEQLADTSVILIQHYERERCSPKTSHLSDMSKNERQVHHCDNGAPNDIYYDNWKNLNMLELASSKIMEIEREIFETGAKDRREMGDERPYGSNQNNKNDGDKVDVTLSFQDAVPHKKQVSSYDMGMPTGFGEEQMKFHEVQDGKGDKEVSHELKATENGMEPEQDIQKHVSSFCETEDFNMSNDSGGDHDKRTDISQHLCSQFPYSQDYVENFTQKDLYLCMKCNKDGELLVCNSTACSIAIHKSCLGFDACFDGRGNFNCPSCAYSMAISKYLETKKNVSSARNELAIFLCGGYRTQFNRKSYRSSGLLQIDLVRDDSQKCNESKGFENKLIKRRKILDSQQTVPSMLRCGDNPPVEAVDFVDKLTASLNKEEQERKRIGHESLSPEAINSMDKLTSGLNKDEQESKWMGQKSQSPKVHGHSQVAATTNGESGDVRSHFESESEVENFHREKTYSSSAESTYSEDISGEENENSGVCKYLIRFRKLETESSDLEFPKLRRKRVPWTDAEELMLKEGMEKFCVSNDDNIPWKKILDHGANVFHESRSAIDLKDKWRNVKKTIMKLYPCDENVES